MSLRRRLVVVIVLGLSAVVIAILAVGHVLADSDAARERAAQTSAESGAQALADALAARPALAASAPARERAPQPGAEPGAQALAAALAARPAALPLVEPLEGEQRRAIQALAIAVLRPVQGAVGGYCAHDGALLAA